MSFTTSEFFVFFFTLLALYWVVKDRRWQNLILLVGSYAFYGWIAAWHVAIIFLSTLIDYLLALGMERWQPKAKLFAWIGVILNLGLLVFFKYYFSFSASLAQLLAQLGMKDNIFFMRIILPLGLSFYLLKKIGYLLDVQRGTFKAERDFIAFAAYVSFFPQVLSGPIDRPQKLLMQLRAARQWKSDNFYNAWRLLVMGFFKKTVIANTVTVIVNEIFEIKDLSKTLLIVGALGFTLQIIADFSSYTDISRGIACLLGLETTENFNRPYLALTPTEFWNRWHISLSTWLRDYIFFPLRRMLVKRKDVIPDVLIQSIPPIVTMFVSGLWHGVGWTFIVWGLYYGALIVIYQLLGIRGDWKPQGAVKTFLAWLVMFALIAFGWALFRVTSLDVIWNSIAYAPLYRDPNELIAGFVLLTMLGFYAALLVVKLLLDQYAEKYVMLQAAYYVAATLMTIMFVNSASPDFIYFQF
jgi:D-alanyl-lipoteichoic acid acyltransferase DltB (MBOAT superfamily)